MAGTVTFTYHRNGPIQKVVALCTADAADGTYPATAIPVPISGRLTKMVTNPGGTAPTANYDITLPNGDAIDLLQSLGANRHTSNTEEVAIVEGATTVNPEISWGDTATLTLANNSVNSAVVVVNLYIEGVIGQE